MTTQRKIGHVLRSEGNGPSFRYLPELAAALDLTQPVIVTEKVDGSTMQCFNGVPFKRYDRFKAGDPRKHGASEEERYELRQCSRENAHEKHYLDAFDVRRTALDCLSRHAWVYFEAMSSKIQSRYPNLAPTIRVFDMYDAERGWWPWEIVRDEVEMLSLPLVAYETRVFGSLDALFAQLAIAMSQDSDLPAHELEGWVLRQGNVVAKIRKKDLARMIARAA